MFDTAVFFPKACAILVFYTVSALGLVLHWAQLETRGALYRRARSSQQVRPALIEVADASILQDCWSSRRQTGGSTFSVFASDNRLFLEPPRQTRQPVSFHAAMFHLSLRFHGSCITIHRVQGTLMPHCKVDQSLLDKVNSLLASSGGNVAAVAQLIGVSRGKLWRFRQSGRAIDRTRTEIALGLEQLGRPSVQNETPSDSKNETDMAASSSSRNTQSKPFDTRRLKQMCELVISLVEQHEALTSGLGQSGTAVTQ